jgi:hypothetical protein
MRTDPVPGRKMFQLAIVMSALWIGANTLLLLKVYGTERVANPKLQMNFSVAELYTDGHFNLVKSEIL